MHAGHFSHKVWSSERRSFDDAMVAPVGNQERSVSVESHAGRTGKPGSGTYSRTGARVAPQAANRGDDALERNPADQVIPGIRHPEGAIRSHRHAGGLVKTRLRAGAVLAITGGWNRDFYAHLVHDTGFAVLLNCIGRTGTMTSSSSGMLVNFDDQAGQDIHRSPPAGSITGSWQPDARTLDPGMVTNASPRSAFLGSFTGVDPKGHWTLFIADLSAGDVGTLNSWALSFTAVPEPGAFIPIAAAAAFLALGRTRRTFPVH